MAEIYHCGDLAISSGCVHGKHHLGWIAHATNGKVDKFNEEQNLSDEEKQQIEKFVELAHNAKRNVFR